MKAPYLALMGWSAAGNSKDMAALSVIDKDPNGCFFG